MSKAWSRALAGDRDDRRRLMVQRGGCDSPWTSAPAPGEVGLDKRADCPRCGRRVAVTARGKYTHHQRTTKKDRGGMR